MFLLVRKNDFMNINKTKNLFQWENIATIFLKDVYILASYAS